MATILVLCTGNICRSPAGELLLDSLLGDDARIHSAGTHAVTGGAIPDEMLEELAGDGIDGTQHRGRQLTPELMLEADVVVAMTRAHRQRAVQLAPAALKRTFTLAELAAAAGTGATVEGDTVAERLAAVPAAVAAHRQVLAGFELSDVPDPYRRGREVYAEAYSLVRGASHEVAAWLQGR